MQACELPKQRARDVMAAPAITVGEDTDIGEVARLLTEYRIKHVPVVRAGEGRVVGIVSRADLVRAMASEHARSAQTEAGAAPRYGSRRKSIADLDHHFAHRSDAERNMPESHGTMKPAPTEILSAADIKRRMAEREARKAAEELRRMREQEAKQKAVRRNFMRHPITSIDQLDPNGGRDALVGRPPNTDRRNSCYSVSKRTVRRRRPERSTTAQGPDLEGRPARYERRGGEKCICA